MNLDHDFVQVWKFSEDQKKMQMEHLFSPNSGEDQKKRSLSKIEHFFSPISGEDQKKKKKVLSKNRTLFFPKFTLRCIPIQIIGRDADVDHSQTIGGDTAKLLGGIYPPIPPGFRHPWWKG